MVFLDEITPLNPSFSVVISGEEEQQECSYKYKFTDTTSINLSEFDRGRICYYIKQSDGNKSMGCTSKNSIFIYEFCSPGTYTIVKELSIREIPNCGGASELIYREEQEFQIEVLEWKPELQIEDPKECFKIDNTVELYPSVLSLNNNVCPANFTEDGGYSKTHYSNHYVSFNIDFNKLVYDLYKYENSTSSWNNVLNQKQYVINTSDPSNYKFTFLADKYGAYKLTTSLHNCCQTVTHDIEFSICDSLKIYRPCKDVTNCEDCNILRFENDSQEDIEITVKDGILNKDIHTFTVNSLQNKDFNAKEDTVYIFEYTLDGKDKTAIVPLFCAINDCYVNLQKILLCENAKDCCDDRELLLSRLNNITSYYQTFLNIVEKYSDLNFRYYSLDINNYLDDFVLLGKLRELILNFCSICRNSCTDCYNWDKGECL